MPRRHAYLKEAEKENLPTRITLVLPLKMRDYLEREAKRLSEESGRTTTIQQLIRALVTSYKERRDVGLITHPDD